MSPRINFRILFYLDLSLPCLEQLHICVCFKVYYLNILKLKATIFQMFFHLVNTEEAWKLQCFLLESNIFISKCFIISYINVRSILETYVRCRNCLTNTLKIWPNFKVQSGASRYKQEQYLKNFSGIFLNYLIYFCSYSPYHTII